MDNEEVFDSDAMETGRLFCSGGWRDEADLFRHIFIINVSAGVTMATTMRR